MEAHINKGLLKFFTENAKELTEVGFVGTSAVSLNHPIRFATHVFVMASREVRLVAEKTEWSNYEDLKSIAFLDFAPDDFALIAVGSHEDAPGPDEGHWLVVLDSAFVDITNAAYLKQFIERFEKETGNVVRVTLSDEKHLAMWNGFGNESSDREQEV